MITFCPFPLPVVTPLGDGFVIYVNEGQMFEDACWAVALKEGGQIRHFTSNQIKVWHNETYGIQKAPPKTGP